MGVVYPGSVNEVVEIDPVVTQVAHEELGLPLETSIKTYNQDAGFFLIQRKTGDKYNVVIGDIFNDLSTPYHLTTLEFNKLLKANMEEDGIYIVNIIDDWEHGRYMPSFIHTLRQTFDHVYLFVIMEEGWDDVEELEKVASTFVIAATDRFIDLVNYREFIAEHGKHQVMSICYNAANLEMYFAVREPILLTDNYVPTDIFLSRQTSSLQR